IDPNIPVGKRGVSVCPISNRTNLLTISGYFSENERAIPPPSEWQTKIAFFIPCSWKNFFNHSAMESKSIPIIITVTTLDLYRGSSCPKQKIFRQLKWFHERIPLTKYALS